MSAFSIIILLLFLPLFVFISIIWDYSFKNKGKYFHWLFGILLFSVFIAFSVYFLYPEIAPIIIKSEKESRLDDEKLEEKHKQIVEINNDTFNLDLPKTPSNLDIRRMTRIRKKFNHRKIQYHQNPQQLYNRKRRASIC